MTSRPHTPVLYTVRAVSERLGIPTATLRSWTRRYGIGPHEHRPGHHRRYSEADIRVVERMHSLIREGASPASAARNAIALFVGQPINPDLLVTAVLRMDSAGAARVVESSLRRHGVVQTWESLCRPAFAAVVARQNAGEGCIDVEHLLSWTVARSLALVPLPSGTGPVSVVLACGPEELHVLPMEALRAALCERDFGVVMLGGAVPPNALIDALTNRGPGLVVVLWAQSDRTASAGEARMVVEAGARLVVAGPGWDSIQRPPGVPWVNTLGAALDHVTAMQK